MAHSHQVDNDTYHEIYTTFAEYAKSAMASGWEMNYGSQPITRKAVLESSNTPLNLSLVDQDCKFFHMHHQDLLTMPFPGQQAVN